MAGRDSGEPHRTSTPLELFFDLCFVVAVAQASGSLHAALETGDPVTGVLRFALVFFTIWWAWMNFTWFASAYDPDDVPYRLSVLLQITGSLVLAAGVDRAFEAGDLTVITVGYVVLRTALAALWLRAALADPVRRRTALRFASGVALCQLGWVGLLLVPTSLMLPGIVVMILAELSVPVWAQSAGMTPWHPGHIAERYGLFTLIVLGESVAAATVAVRGAFNRHHGTGPLWALAAGGLLMAFAMWWLYFARPAHALLATTHQDHRRRFPWAYGHYLVFASATAEGAGLASYADHVTRHTTATSAAAGAAITVPAAVFLLTVWAVQLRPHQKSPAERLLFPVAAVGVLAASWTAAPALVSGLLLAAAAVVAGARHR
ncbi:low temperature requirement protein A [Streptomyces rochei]|uniref:low temperature requirement protein A n=2 Tax=Streptomyces TaxID=1883 RepID=UPI000A39F78F|nr:MULTISPECIES: low temperature requirement protein A [Streptomyces]MBQ0881999.1 low temperature requirement protein A [Streptomyces sp. RT42]MDI3097171.1 low temperature requirement protein A [Streptomyces sp. AN-3]WDI19875.1 low temperature requirement protein A [Streptomyces enissocaesilis]